MGSSLVSWPRTPRRSRTYSSRSPGGSSAMSDEGARTWRDNSLAQLTLVRFREFLREPEAVFWTFAFPIILAIGLGIAFRNKPADVIAVGVVSGDPVAVKLANAPGLKVQPMDDSSAARALRTGEVA